VKVVTIMNQWRLKPSVHAIGAGSVAFQIVWKDLAQCLVAKGRRPNRSIADVVAMTSPLPFQ
jgi:hypothetical protein